MSKTTRKGGKVFDRKGRKVQKMRNNRIAQHSCGLNFNHWITYTYSDAKVHAAVTAGSLVLLASSAYALPQGGAVAGGNATISTPTNNTMQIRQNSDKTIINWQGYSIAGNEAVRYFQPGANSIALNRVIGRDPSLIYGQLSANGQVWVINPNGLLVGQGAKIETAGFLASTLNISDQNFLAGKYVFTSPSSSLASVVNLGKIIVPNGSYVTLLGSSVKNEGTILANAGKVFLASGEEVTLNFAGNDLISLVVDKATQNDLGITNTGTITADGGTILLSAKTASDVLKNVVNNEGIIQARSLVQREGKIILDGGDAGIVANSGTLDVSSAEAGAKGGSIGLFGKYVGLFGYAKLDASGDAGGGTVLIGGNFQGKGPESNAYRTYVGKDVTIKADALTSGDGGRVIVWSNDTTRFYGNISAKGGLLGGNGGFVEVSGKRSLDFNGMVNTYAPMGQNGTLLLDPSDISIVATDPPLETTGSGADGDPFKPDGNGNSHLGWNSINAVLGGSNVTVSTVGTPDSAGENGDIFVTQAGALNSANRLTLTAARNITFSPGANVINSSTGNLVFNAQGAGAIDLNNANISTGGSVSFDSASTIAGSGNITGGGALSAISRDAVNLSGILSTTTLTVKTLNDAGAAITLTNAANEVTAIDLRARNAADNANAAGAISYRDATGFNIAAAQTGGNVTLQNGGAVTQSGDIQAAGLELLGSGAYTLTRSTNAVTTLAGNTTNTIDYRDTDALAIGTVNTAGLTSNNTVTLTAGGAVTQTAPIAATTLTVKTLNDAGAAITLTNAANEVTAIDLRARNAADNANAAGAISYRDATGFNIAAAQTGGTLDLVAGGNITNTGALNVTGDASFTAPGGNSIAVANGGNSFGGTVTFSSAGTLLNVSVLDTTSLDLQALTVTGDLTATGAGLTQGGALVVPGTATFTSTGANDVLLNNAANNFGTALVTSGQNATLRDTNAVILGAHNITGNLDWTAGGNITNTGALTVGGTTTISNAGNDVTLDNAANNFTGAVSVTGQNVTLVDANAIVLGASTIGGTYNVTATAGGNITNTGALNVTGDASFTAPGGNSIAVANGGNSFGGTVTFSSAGTLLNVSVLDTTSLDLQALTVTGDLTATGAGLTQGGALVVPGTATFTSTGANDVLLNNAANNFGTALVTSGQNATLRDTNAVILGAHNITGNLDWTAGGNITNTGALNVTGDASFTAPGGNSIAVANGGNSFGGTVTFSSAGTLLNVSVLDTTSLDLQALTVTGDLTATGAGLTQGGALVVPGTATFTSTGANDVLLNNAANNFGTALVTSGQNATLRDTNAVILGAHNITGNLDWTAGGNITNTGALNVTGDASFTAPGGNSIAVANGGNSFGGTVTFSSAGTLLNVSVLDTTSLDLQALTVTGDLTATGAGLTQGGALVVPGTATFTSTGANDVLLNNAANNFGTALVTSGQNATLRDTNAVILGAHNITGNLDWTAGGNITNTGALTVGGTTTISNAGNDVTLDNAANNFTGAVSVTGQNVTLVDANAIVLGASTIGGTYNVTATAGGNITNTGALNVTGDASFTAPGGNSIAVANGGNSFGGTVTFSSAGTLLNVSVLDTTSLDLQALTVTGDLTATGAGLTQGGALVVPGTATFTSTGANDVLLNNAANNFGTALVTSGQNATLRDTNAVILGAHNITGNLDWTAGGNITNTGALNVTGDASFTAPGGNSIAVANGGNSFGGTVTFSSAGTLLNVSVLDTTSLDLQALTVTGDLTATGAGLTQGGALVVPGTATFTSTGANDVLLNNAANNFGTALVTSGQNATLRDTNAVILGAHNITGNLDWTAGGAVTQTAPIAATTLTVKTLNDAGAAITLTNAANEVTAIDLRARNAADNANAAGAISYRDATGFNIAAAQTGGNVTLQNGGAVTQSGDIQAAGLELLGSGAYTLTRSTNAVTTLAGNTTNTIDYRDTDALAIGTVNTAGLTSNNTVTLTAGGAVTQTAPIAATTLTVKTLNDAGAAITLTNAANEVTAIDLRARNAADNANAAGAISYRDATGFNIAAAQTGGTLDLVAGGNITNTGALNVTGDASFTAPGGNSIAVANGGNSFGGTVTFSSAGTLLNVSVLDTTSLDLQALTVTGDLTATGAGLTQGGALVVPGTATFTSTGANDVLLNNAANNFGTALVTSGQNATLRDTNAVILGAHNITGNLDWTAGGAVTQTAPIAATTLTVKTLNDAGAAITLTNAANEVTAIDLRARNAADNANAAGAISYRDATGFNIAAAQTGGNVTLQNGGAVTQSGDIQAAGLELLGSGAYTLTRSTNAVTTLAGNTTNTIDYRDTDALAIGTVNTAGLTSNNTVTLTAGGAVTQTAPIAATTLTVKTLNDAGAAITLTNAANEVTAIDLRARNAADNANAAGAISYRDATGFNIAAAQTGGNVTLQNGGAVTQSGDIQAAGLELLGSGAYTLTRSTNAVTTLAGNTTNTIDYRDTDALAIGTVNTAGLTSNNTVTLTAGGAVTQTAPIAATTLTVKTLNDAGAAITLTNAANEVTAIDLRARNAADNANAAGAISYRDATGFNIAAAQTGGTVNLTAGGAVTQTAPIAATTLTVKTLNDAGAAITLTNAANEVTAIDLRARNAADNANAAGAISYRDATGFNIAAAQTGGNVTLQNGGAVTQSGDIQAAGLELLGSGAYTLTRSTNAVTTLAGNTTNTIDYRDTDALAIGTVNTAGLTSNNTVTLTAGGAVTQTAPIAATTLTVKTLNDAGAAITLTNAANEVTAIDLRARNAADNANAAGAISYRDATGFNIAAAQTGGNVTLQNGGAVTQSGDIQAAGLELLGSGAYTLTRSTNAVTTLAGNTTNTIDYRDTDALAIGTVNTAGLTSNNTVTLTAGGAVTQTAPIAATTLTVKTLNDAGAAITLTNAANEVTAIDLRARNAADNANAAGAIAYRDATGFTVSGLGTTSTVSLSAGGIIADSGAITGSTLTTSSVGGTVLDFGHSVTGFNATNTGGGDIQLVNTGNLNVTGVSQAGGGNVIVTNTGTIGISGAVNTAAGSTILTATNAITQTAPITTTTLAAKTLNDTGAPITLTNAANEAAIINLQARNAADNANAAGAIAYRDATGFTVSGLGTTSTVSLSAGGIIADSGAITGSTLTTSSVGGTVLDFGHSVTGFNATNTGGGDIQLVNTGNLNVTGVSQAGGGNVIVTNTGTIGISGAVNTAAGSTVLTATNAITQTAPIAATTLTVKTLNDAGAAITLTNAANEVTAIDLRARNAADNANAAGAISYRDATGFNIAAAQTGGNVTLQNGGAVTQSGDIQAAGLELLGSGAYTLTRSTNAVTTLAGNTTNTIDYRDTDALAIGTVNTAGLTSNNTVTLTAGGAVTQTAPIAATTLTVKTLNDAGAAITLTNAANEVTAIDLRARNAADNANAAGAISYRDATGFNIAAAQTGGNVTLQNGGAVTQSGDIQAAGLELLGSGAYTLTRSTNAVTTLAGNTTNTIDYRDTDALAIGTVNTAGLTSNNTVTLTAGGAVTQTAPIAATTLTVKTLNDAGAAITLTNQNNKVAAIDLRARNAADNDYAAGAIDYVDADGFNISSEVHTTGTVTLTARNGSIMGGGVTGLTILFTATTIGVDSAGNSAPVSVSAGGTAPKPITVKATGQYQGVSAQFTGADSTITMINPVNPPGYVFFNGRFVNPEIQNLAEQAAASSASTLSATEEKVKNMLRDANAEGFFSVAPPSFTAESAEGVSITDEGLMILLNEDVYKKDKK